MAELSWSNQSDPKAYVNPPLSTPWPFVSRINFIFLIIKVNARISLKNWTRNTDKRPKFIRRQKPTVAPLSSLPSVHHCHRDPIVPLREEWVHSQSLETTVTVHCLWFLSKDIHVSIFEFPDYAGRQRLKPAWNLKPGGLQRAEAAPSPWPWICGLGLSSAHPSLFFTEHHLYP